MCLLLYKCRQFLDIYLKPQKDSHRNKEYYIRLIVQNACIPLYYF